MLNRIARSMALAENFQAALDQALAIASGLFPGWNLGVWQLDDEDASLYLRAFHAVDMTAPPLLRNACFPGGDDVKALLAHLAALHWSTAQPPPRCPFVSFLQEDCGYQRLILLPLVASARTVGVLMLAGHTSPYPWAEEDQATVEVLVHQLAEAMHVASVLEALCRSNEQLQHQSSLLQAVVDAVPTSVFAKDAEGYLILANRAAAEVHGLGSQNLVGYRDEDLGIDSDTAAHWREINRQVMRTGQPHYDQEQFIRHGSTQEERWFQTVIAPLRDATGHTYGVVGSLTDVTERRAAQQALEQQRAFLQRVIDVSPAAIWVKDLAGRYQLINQAGAAIYGSTPEAMLHRWDSHTYLDAEIIHGWHQENCEVAESGVPRLIPERMIPGLDGQPRWFRVAIAPLDDQHGASESVIVAATDITERVLAERRLAEANRELQRLAHQDGLTGLANRRYLDESLAREWHRLRRQGQALAVALLDVDYFKSYNDLLGHLQGDDCLRQVASCIAGALQRSADLAGRFGGEEFLLILPDTDREGALAVARRVNQAVAALGIPHPGSPLGYLSVSLGVAVAVPREDNPQALIKAADGALYQAKHAGRDRVAVAAFFD